MTRSSDLVLTRRRSHPSDEAFLRRLFASTREAELHAIGERGMDPVAFLDLQFRAQDAAYRAQFPRASRDVIEAGGRPVGRLYVNVVNKETRVIDISLLPDWRNRGIGRRVLSELIRHSHREGSPVTLHVAAGNPARHLYEGLGFVALEDDGVHAFMRRAVEP